LLSSWSLLVLVKLHFLIIMRPFVDNLIIVV
jgi:hypothetical protein